MLIDATRSVTGTVATDASLLLRLAGGWTEAPVVTVDGEPAAITLSSGVLEVQLPAGAHMVRVG